MGKLDRSGDVRSRTMERGRRQGSAVCNLPRIRISPSLRSGIITITRVNDENLKRRGKRARMADSFTYRGSRLFQLDFLIEALKRFWRRGGGRPSYLSSILERWMVVEGIITSHVRIFKKN